MALEQRSEKTGQKRAKRLSYALSSCSSPVQPRREAEAASPSSAGALRALRARRSPGLPPETARNAGRKERIAEPGTARLKKETSTVCRTNGKTTKNARQRPRTCGDSARIPHKMTSTPKKNQFHSKDREWAFGWGAVKDRRKSPKHPPCL